MRCRMIHVVCLLCCVIPACRAAGVEAKKETLEEFAKRTQWWQEAKFGMFIHWGIYAVPADGEWYMNNKKVQVADYEKYAPQFNPVDFDAKEWVRVAKGAGMKYITITSKHHDGFCMWDTKLTDYSIMKATPFKRDVLKELAAACREEGIRLCFYHSIMDWHHPDYLPRREWEKTTRPADGADLNRYIDYMKGQLRELLTGYGPIGVIWFDGGWEHNAQELRSVEVDAMIRSLQPGILINDRNQLPEDFSTPEQTIPAGAMSGGRLWETCMTLNNNWGWAKNDHNWKSVEDLTRKLIDIAHKGGNFLLNVGPTEKGKIPQESVDRLAAVGQWMKVNGESIYGSTKNPFKKLPFDGRCTVKGDTLYIHVFKWPAEGVQVPGLKTEVKSASFLDGEASASISVAKDENGVPVLTIKPPAKADPIATVVVLKLAGAPDVENVSAIQTEKEGKFSLKAIDAEVEGQTAHYENNDGKDNIGFWIDKNDYVFWPITVKAEGDYSVEVTYACEDGSAGSEFTVGISEAANVSGKIDGTGAWNKFKAVSLGKIHLPAGKQTLAVKATSMPRGAMMNLKEVVLKRMP